MKDADEVAPLAQQSLPEVVQAIELNEVGVRPVLLVQDVQWTVVPLMLLIEVIAALAPALPMATQNVVLLHASWVNELMVADGL